MRNHGVSIAGAWTCLLALAAACASDGVRFEDGIDAQSNEFGMSAERRRGAPKPAAEETAPLADAGAGGIQLPPSVTLAPTGTFMCGAEACQCNNGIDDDGDGTADGFDVECTGGIDDDEGSFATGIPGDNRDPKWQDCFFDGNSGHGDDRCRYPTECLTGELPPEDEACSVTQECRDNCQPRTPLGCDCFGCCSVELPGGGAANILLVSSCSVEKIGDTEACPVCTPSAECTAAPPPDPDPTVPDPNEPDPNEPDPNEPDPNQPDPNEPDPNEPDPNQPDPNQPPSTCEGRTECDEAGGCPMGEFCSQGCCLLVIR